MSTTTNAVLAVTLTSAAFVGGALLIPDGEALSADGGIVDAGPQGPLIGNFYLRFPDQQTFDAEVRSTPFWQWETGYTDAGPDGGLVPVTLDSGALIQTAMGHNFDIVGVISRPIPGSDGGTETLDGWHVNFSGILPDAWQGYIVQPENPVRGMR